jgi:hypothetical protein
MLTDIGFTDVNVGPAVDTFGGAHGEPNAHTFDVKGYPFIARKPGAAAGAKDDPGA